MNFWIKENLYIVIAVALLSPVAPWILRTLFKEPRTDLQKHLINDSVIIVWAIAVIAIVFNAIVMMK